MCADMCTDLCIVLCIDVCIDTCVDTCIGTRTDVSTDICADVCTDMCRHVQKVCLTLMCTCVRARARVHACKRERVQHTETFRRSRIDIPARKQKRSFSMHAWACEHACMRAGKRARMWACGYLEKKNRRACVPDADVPTDW